MAENKSVKEMNNLKRSLKTFFSDRPHDVYVVYDDLMDELIVRFNDPKRGSASYFCGANSAILVDVNADQVVGFEVYHFSVEFLPKMSDLKNLWKEENLPAYFDNYRKFRYEPSSSKKKNSKPVFNLKFPERVMDMAIAC